ncbi:hypothetical protein MRX96_031598 [Rhipicephalus microplus]
MPEVAPKEPIEHESDDKMEWEDEKSAEGTPGRAAAEVDSKKPTEHEGVEKLEPEFEKSTEEYSARAVPEIESKRPTTPQGAEKMEGDLGRFSYGNFCESSATGRGREVYRTGRFRKEVN